MTLTTSSITTSMAKVMSVSTGLSTIIMAIVPAKFSEQEMRLPKLLLRASEMVSISLVYRLISSPWVWVSKNFSGRLCIRSKRSERILATVFWDTWTMMRA